MSLRHLPILATIVALSVASIPVFAIPNQNNGNFLSQILAQNSGDVETPKRDAQQPKKRDRKNNLMQELNLSETQKQEIEQIRQEYQGKIAESRISLREAQQELVQMMTGTDPAEAIRTKHEEVAQLQQNLSQLRFESMLEMREVLSPEQRQEFAQILQSRQHADSDRPRNRFENKDGF